MPPARAAQSDSVQPRGQQFGEQGRVGGDVLQADGHVGGAVEVAAQARVRHARDLADVLDVVGDLGQRRLRRRRARSTPA